MRRQLPKTIDPAAGGSGSRTVLLPYQQVWLGDTADVKIYEKSRRIGISWAEAADAALIAGARDGQDYWYVGYNKDMAQEFISDAANWLKAFNVAAGEVGEEVITDEEKDILTFKITCASGHRITALSSRPTNLRGKQGVVCIDEAAFHQDLDQLIKAAMALLIWGGKVRLVSTHFGVENTFNELIELCRTGKRPYSVHRTTFSQAIEQGLYRRICLKRDMEWTAEGESKWVQSVYDFYGDDAAEELDVVPSRSGDRYLPRVVVEQCMQEGIPVIRLKLKDEFALQPEYVRERTIEDWCQAYLKPHLDQADENLKSSFGQDFARSGDLSVLIPAQEERDLVRRWLMAVELRNVPFESQKQIVFFICDRLPRFIAGAFDASGNGAYLAEVAAQRYGFGRIHQVKLSGSWYLENMPKYKGALEDRKVEIARDSDILDDHGDVILQNGVPLVPAGKRKGSDGGQRHGDSAIAAALQWFASEQTGGPIEFMSLGEQRPSHGAYRDTLQPELENIDLERGFGVLRGTDRFRGFN